MPDIFIGMLLLMMSSIILSFLSSPKPTVLTPTQRFDMGFGDPRKSWDTALATCERLGKVYSYSTFAKHQRLRYIDALEDAFDTLRDMGKIGNYAFIEMYVNDVQVVCKYRGWREEKVTIGGYLLNDPSMGDSFNTERPLEFYQELRNKTIEELTKNYG